MDCGECQQPMPTDGDGATCSVCQRMFHFETCCSLKPISWKTYGARRATWRCPSCKLKKGGEEENNSDGENDESLAEGGTAETCGALSVMLEKKFQEFEKKMTENISKGFAEASKEMKSKFLEFESALNFYGEKFEEAVKTVKNVEQKMVLVEKRLDKSEMENRELKTRLRNMEIEIHEVEQRKNNNIIEISGINNKDILPQVAVNTILETAGYARGEIETRVTKVTKLVGEKKQEKTVLLVQFKSEDERNKVLTKFRKEKIYDKLEKKINNDGSSIYIGESLTPYYKRLFYEANKIKKDKEYQYLWIKSGVIRIRKDANSTIMKLSCMDDIGRL